MASIKPPINENSPLCKCGCGQPVNWRPGKGWATYIKGHGNRNKILSEKVKQNIQERGPREGPTPLCKCGCGQPVNWRDGEGWCSYIIGHSEKNKEKTEKHKKKISEGIRKAYKGRRNRDLEETPGGGIYTTWEYKEARKKLVEGKPCYICDSTENVHAHHRIPGDDSSLVPVCVHCHPTEHAMPGAKGQNPSDGEKAPFCACGCGQRVKWKRVRGWAKYCKGHGTAKVPTGTRLEEPPLCACGCGEPVKFRHGKGWNKYKRGHGQRVEGHYTQKRKQKK